MQEAMETLRRISPEVIAAAIVGLDGEIMASSAKGELAEVVGPLATTFTTMAVRTAQELGRGTLETSILEASYGRVVVREIGDGRVLVVVAEPTAHLGLLIDDVRACSDQVAREVAHA